MADLSQFPVGSTVDITFRGVVDSWTGYGRPGIEVGQPVQLDGKGVKISKGKRLWPETVAIATSVTLVQPEIVPGAVYLDAEGRHYLGGSDRKTVWLTQIDGERNFMRPALAIFGRATPLPAGLRRAKVVPADD